MSITANKSISRQLKRNKFFYFIFLMFILNGCTKRSFTPEQVKELEPTHSIVDNSMIKFFHDFEKKENFDLNSDTYIVYVKKVNDTKHEVSIAKTRFKIFRREKDNLPYFQKLKGYLLYQNSIVLLYGDIDNSIFKSNNNKVEDILFNDSTEKAGMMIYEPVFVDYQLLK